jgi:spore coat polysaccharide biosynthesis protein SpsF (cytidylyltransferase family)
MENGADYVLRITGDSPFLDIEKANELVGNMDYDTGCYEREVFVGENGYTPIAETKRKIDANHYDYIAHYKPKESNPTVAKYAWGCMAELVKTDALYSAYKYADEYEREHVTSYIYNHPQKYKIKRIELQTPFPLTVSIDDEKTYQQAKRMMKGRG